MTSGGGRLLFAAVMLSAIGCAKPINDGGACFQNSECRSESICAQTVYGNFCMQRCTQDQVRCASGASCLRAREVGADPGTDGGTDGGAGTGGDMDAGTEPLYACLPARLEIPGYVPRILGQVCDVSLDCELGAICVCIPGAICEGEGKNGPTCQRLCDPTILNQCPIINNIQPQCTDLGDGRGFCDITTVTLRQ